MNATRIVEVSEPGGDLDAVYRDLLRPNFPGRELEDKADIEAGLRGGTAGVVVAVDDGGDRVGAAVGHWDADSRIALLSHLAVDPGSRSGSVGASLLDAARVRWAERHRPCAVLAEVEHPLTPASESAWGEAARRYEFYLRRGARILDLPYFQPALREGAERGYGMLLAVLHLDPELRVGPGGFDAEALRRFVSGYFTAAEGRIPDDPAGRALFEALAAGKGVPILDPATTPVGLLPRSRP